MGKYGYCGMKKVLVPGTNEDVHYIKLYNHLGSLLPEGKTLCGQQLHPINTVHVTKINVTCEKCLKLADEVNTLRRAINQKSVKKSRGIIDKAAELDLCLQAKICPVCTEYLTVLSCNGVSVYKCGSCSYTLTRDQKRGKCHENSW